MIFGVPGFLKMLELLSPLVRIARLDDSKSVMDLAARTLSGVLASSEPQAR